MIVSSSLARCLFPLTLCYLLVVLSTQTLEFRTSGPILKALIKHTMSPGDQIRTSVIFMRNTLLLTSDHLGFVSDSESELESTLHIS